jgi:AcrR family transcriptional regulator
MGSRVYRSSRRAEQARATRRRILDAATTVFLERGYAAATMRVLAGQAGVSVPTVELLFGTKVKLLKAAIDVAIAGDDEPVPMLDREWANAGADFLDVAAEVLTSAQERSAGLVLAVFEGASADPELAALAEQMTTQRATTAAWIVDRLAPLRCDRDEAVDTVWILMDPAVFHRLTRRRGWTPQRYRQWFARSVARLLTDERSTA